MDKVACIAFTEAGCALALELAAGLGGDVNVSGPERFAGALGIAAYESLEAWTAEAFATADALVFVGASGIAVRAIAPHVEDKFADPAVVCVDELGRVAVPLLSGHVGGANDLARAVAECTGGIAAVSTATDLNGVFAIDEFACDNGLRIAERDLAKRISAALLAGEPVGFGEGLGAVVGDPGSQPFDETLHLVPRDVVVGVGCRRGAPAEAIGAAVDAALAGAGLSAADVAAVATIDVKSDEAGLLELARRREWELVTFSADELDRVEGDFSGSEFVRETVGVDNVCERAIVAAGGRIVSGKQAFDGVAVAVGRRRQAGKLAVVGLGPGGALDMTRRAREALGSCDVIVGYTVYADLVRGEFPGKEVLTTPMRKEVERCRLALGRAAGGERVAMVCSGDPGVYGMAGLVLELSGEFPGVEVEVVPGVSASNGGAAVLGAPLMHDSAVISLSDLLTPWELIERRLAAAAEGDFCISLYNPASHKRPDHLRRACDVLLAHRAPETVCGIVRNIGREGEQARVLTLGELRDASVDMFTTVFIGNSQTREIDGRMVTPRGYPTNLNPPPAHNSGRRSERNEAE